jgi:hypothetical protein
MYHVVFLQGLDVIVAGSPVPNEYLHSFGVSSDLVLPLHDSDSWTVQILGKVRKLR